MNGDRHKDELGDPLLPDGQRNDGGGGSDEQPGNQESAGQVAKQHGGQAARMLANLINAGIGTSTVAMPLAVAKLGIGVAAGAMAAQLVLGVLSNHILSRQACGDPLPCTLSHDTSPPWL
jgi:hypothetical protein